MDSLRMANAVLLRKLLLAVLLMFGFAWLLVPLYRVLCEVSGLNRVVPLIPCRMPALICPARPVALQLDAMVQPGLPWQVRPLQSRLQVKTGQFVQLQYEMRNNSAKRGGAGHSALSARRSGSLCEEAGVLLFSPASLPAGRGAAFRWCC
jgi:cytochrome c oxidase assembly protein subunit 11